MSNIEQDIEKLTEEKHQIESLLKDKDFAHQIAKSQNDAYYFGIGEMHPVFLEEKDTEAVLNKSVKEEKIAINLAGFYALESGIGALCERDGEKPTDWLQRIVSGEMDAQDISLLNHFANATWKAGQPFRGLDRLTRPVFTVFSLLPEVETAKDFVQIQTAAQKLLASLKAVREASAQDQMNVIRELMQNTTYALEMATFLAASYYTAQNMEVPPFITSDEEQETSVKSVREEKIAINLAGFYALECGVDYLAGIQNKLPSEILESIADDTVLKSDKQVLCRFANATWKAGQPFRGLDRIMRDVFTPFDFLSKEDVAKDWVQVKSAAMVLSNAMKRD